MSRNALTMEQALALYNWLVETADRRARERWTRSRCCKLARRDLGFGVTPNNVESVIAKSGGKLQMWDAPQDNPLAGAAMVNHRITALADDLARLRTGTNDLLADTGRALDHALERVTALERRIRDLEGAIMAPGPVESTTVPTPAITAPAPDGGHGAGVSPDTMEAILNMPFPARQRLARALDGAARRATAGGTVEESLANIK